MACVDALFFSFAAPWQAVAMPWQAARLAWLLKLAGPLWFARLVSEYSFSGTIRPVGIEFVRASAPSRPYVAAAAAVAIAWGGVERLPCRLKR